ncbi:uncharacterized protein PG986_008019 [Apiospora aurea]|uniref:Uncharacterized protein n=1 Tax=Apiospora aurea TaxID=335848 RepID=A0ABR1QF02_9PEZI
METQEEPIPSMPSSPEIKCEPLDEDLDDIMPLGTAQAIAVHGLAPQHGTTADSPVSLNQQSGHHETLGPITDAVFRPHPAGPPGSSLTFGAPASPTAQQLQPGRSRTQAAPLAEPSENARGIAFFHETLRQLDPCEATPPPFFHIMTKAAMRDPEIAMDIERLHVQKSPNPPSQALEVPVSCNRPPNMQPNGLPYPQLDLQRPYDAPQTPPRSQNTPQPSTQPWASLQSHAMPYSQTTLQHQSATQATSQLVPQPANEPNIAGSQTMHTQNNCNPTNYYSNFTQAAQHKDGVWDNVQHVASSQVSVEGDSHGEKDGANKNTYGELDISCGVSDQSAGDVPEKAITQPGFPAQQNSFHPKPLQIISPPRSRGPETPFVASSGAPVGTSPAAPEVPPSTLGTKPFPITPPIPTPTADSNDEPLSMRRDAPVDFTWMVDQAEAELGRTGKYDHDTPTRRRSRAVLAASQIGRLLKKLDGKMGRHTRPGDAEDEILRGRRRGADVPGALSGPVPRGRRQDDAGPEGQAQDPRGRAVDAGAAGHGEACGVDGGI